MQRLNHTALGGWELGSVEGKKGGEDWGWAQPRVTGALERVRSWGAGGRGGCTSS